MNSLPVGCDPRRLDLDPAEITRVEPLQQKHGHAVYRVACGERSWVLKWFPDAAAIEVANYALLEALGVPTLRVHARTPRALLLEDLGASPAWRLATAADAEDATVGEAAAAWYRTLHAVGRTVVNAPGGPPTHLSREADPVDARALRELGERFGLTSAPGWALCLDSIDVLQAALRALPETLTYGDFHWTNLALSRRVPRRAVVFDYHLLGLGPAESDLRNVRTVLGRSAWVAFREEYGPVDERALSLDAPIALLHSLREASRLPALPRWGKAVRDAVLSGDLERSVRRALAVA